MAQDMKITADGRVKGGWTDEMIARAADLRPCLRQFRGRERQEATYQGNRFSGGRNGAISNDPGYSDHVSMVVTEDGLVIESTRPFLPDTTEEFELEVADAILDYVIGGDV